MDLLRSYGLKRAIPYAINDFLFLLRTDQPRAAALIAHEELCVRTAQQYRRLQRIPFNTDLLEKLHVETFAQLHASMQSISKRDSRALYKSARVFQGLTAMHGSFEQELMEGVKGIERQGDATAGIMNDSVNDLMAGRIGTMLLLRQTQRLLSQAASATREGVVPDDGGGPLMKAINIAGVARGAGSVARGLCERTHGVTPEVQVSGDLDSEPITVPAHATHVLTELLKNALNATAHRHLSRLPGPATPDHPITPPHVLVRVAGGEDDISVRVSDEGQGMKRRHLPHAFDFCYSTSASPEQRVHGTDAERGGHVSGGRYHVPPPLAGMGLGLPLSRLYARHFGGDLSLLAVENGGAEATLWLPTSTDICEAIPVTV